MDEGLGSQLVKLARLAITSYLKSGRIADDKSEIGLPRRGVFVSIYEHPTKRLRGCIGYPYPVDELKQLVVKAALAAAFHDPRFPPLRTDELDSVVLEISLLTEPEPINVKDRRRLPEVIAVGRDGLIIESRYGSGLLLPQVPAEYGWDAEEFLVNLCLKAGLSPTYWLEDEPIIKRFSADIFAERWPGGPVYRVEVGSC